jgi:hypothetical protein
MSDPFAALRGDHPPERYSARDVMRGSHDPACGALPLMHAAGIRPDTVATIALELGVGPDPKRGMSNLARQQGDTWDETLFADGRPLVDALVRDGYLRDHDVDIVNVTDHVDPTRAADGTPAHRGGRAADREQRERERVTYNRARSRMTDRIVADALAADRPTLVLRGLLEATPFLHSPTPTFLEFDFGLVLPPGHEPPEGEVGDVVGRPPAIVLGDGKSWRKLPGRRDDGDKRAETARQVAAYAWVARNTWTGIASVAVLPFGLIANPPASGGLASVRLTRVDLRDHDRALDAQLRGARTAVADQTSVVVTAVADGATFFPDASVSDPEVARRAALRVVLDAGRWLPSCLSACPMGRACRRDLVERDAVARLGSAADEATPVTTIDRLSRLRRGTVSPTQAEVDVAERLADADRLLGPDPDLPSRVAR